MVSEKNDRDKPWKCQEFGSVFNEIVTKCNEKKKKHSCKTVKTNAWLSVHTGFSEAEIKYKLVDKVPKTQDSRRKDKKPTVKIQHRRAEPVGSKYIQMCMENKPILLA